MKRHRLTRAAFRRWLRAKPPAEEIADPAGCYDCAVAQWLMDAGAPAPYVWFNRYWEEEGEGEGNRLPRWAQSFIHRIGWEPRPVTWGRAAAILEES